MHSERTIKRGTAQSTLCVDNKKDKTAKSRVTDITKKVFFGVKKAAFKKGQGDTKKMAGRHALQKRPRQNTVQTGHRTMDTTVRAALTISSIQHQ